MHNDGVTNLVRPAHRIDIDVVSTFATPLFSKIPCMLTYMLKSKHIILKVQSFSKDVYRDISRKTKNKSLR